MPCWKPARVMRVFTKGDRKGWNVLWLVSGVQFARKIDRLHTLKEIECDSSESGFLGVPLTPTGWATARRDRVQRTRVLARVFLSVEFADARAWQFVDPTGASAHNGVQATGR